MTKTLPKLNSQFMKIFKRPLTKFLRKHTCHGARSRQCPSLHRFDGLTVFNKQQKLVLQPPYSPDWAPSAFFSSRMKRSLKGNRFSDVEEVKENTLMALNSILS
ncbi:hypothetical protein TNCV_1931931 [Trichonephila clavipes]|nr:hypothetical protein TNCV_1931931 [Trichonephila clavipes]